MPGSSRANAIMYNNVSYRQFSVTGTTVFFFDAVGLDRANAFPRSVPGRGRASIPSSLIPASMESGCVGYKVTNPSAGVWHYEYAVYNENLDRAIQSFSVPLGCGITVSNVRV